MLGVLRTEGLWNLMACSSLASSLMSKCSKNQNKIQNKPTHRNSGTVRNTGTKNWQGMVLSWEERVHMVGWIMLPQRMCWSPNPQDLWMWPNLETESSKMRSWWSGVGPNSVTGILIRKGEETERCTVWMTMTWDDGGRLESCMHKPGMPRTDSSPRS